MPTLPSTMAGEDPAPSSPSASSFTSSMCRGPLSMDDAETKSPAAVSAGVEESVSLLLELSAADDLAAFKLAVEESNLPLDAAAPWYSRSVGPASSPARRMGYEHRTPLAIAALYGSTSVLCYILSRKSVDVNRRWGSDGATALHCAAAGGSSDSLHAVKLLIEASADVDAIDAVGNRPGEVIAKQFSASMARDLEVILKAPCPRVSSPSNRQIGEKKEYPPDLTLPDIKNGIYGTDEFRMYTFKVKPCSRAYSHDWTECPFVHPGENARRRDPRKFSYSCVPCPEFRKGSCLKGDACEYAHGVFESWLHPAQYRTRLCKDEIGCNRRVCFFAHKLEELRSVNPTAASVSGLALSSPRSSKLGVSSLDMAAIMMMQQAPGSPMSPSASSAMGSPLSWMNPAGSMVQPPTLQLPSSRLKSSMCARDLDFDLELMGLEGYQQKLLDEISIIASPRSNWKANSFNNNAAPTATSRVSDYTDLLDQSMLFQLQGLSLKQAGASTGLQMNQSVSQQLLSAYGSNRPSSPTVNTSSSFGLDHSLAKAIMNSRQAAFAKRSQSFIDRGAVPRQTILASPPTSAAASPPPGLSDWGSPNGKLDWGIQGDELNKMRKSSSFNFRSIARNNFGGSASPPKAPAVEEPDLSWVQHLVKDGPAMAAPPGHLPPVGGGRLGFEQHQKYQPNANGAGDFLSWEQLYAEQEQLVA